MDEVVGGRVYIKDLWLVMAAFVNSIGAFDLVPSQPPNKSGQ